MYITSAYQRIPLKIDGTSNTFKNLQRAKSTIIYYTPPNMSFSKPAVKRKVGDENRQFQEKWGIQYFFVEHRGTTTCLIGTKKVAVHKKYSLKPHYTTRHAEDYAKYQGDERANRVANLKTCLLKAQDFFKGQLKYGIISLYKTI